MPSAPRSFVSMKDLSPDDLHRVLEKAAKVKKNPSEYRAAFAGKTLAMIFQKPSLRTRVSFEVKTSVFSTRPRPLEQLQGTSLDTTYTFR